jgi:hypothetical protein
MPLKVKSGKTGKTYDMPWSLPNDPSDDEIDTFIATQEASNPTSPVRSIKTEPGTYLHGSGGKTRGFFESALPESNRNYTPETLPSFPVRAAKEILYEGIARPAASPAGAAGEGLGAVGGMGFGPAIKSGLSSLVKKIPVLDNIFNSEIGQLPSIGAPPVSTSKPLPVKPIVPDELAGVRPRSQSFTPVGEEPPLTKPVFKQPDPVESVMSSTAKGSASVIKQRGGTETKFTLPSDLRGAKPRFNSGNKVYIPHFDNDIDKAAYIIAQINPSKRDADFLKFFMDSTGMSEQAARAYGKQVRGRIKANAVGAEPGDLRIPDMFSGYKKTTPLTKTEITNAAIVKDGIEGKMTSLPHGYHYDEYGVIQPNNPGIPRFEHMPSNRPLEGTLPVKPAIRTNPDGTISLKNPSRETLEQAGRSGYHPATGELAPDGSIVMVKSDANVFGTTPVAPVTGPSPMNLKGKRNENSFIEGIDGGQIPPTGTTNVMPPSGMPPNPPKKVNPLIRLGVELKSATAGLDLSAPLRQGRALMHKKEFYKALPDMFKAMKSETGFDDLMNKIKSHPDYELASNSKLNLMGLTDDITQREEAIMGNMVEKIPGIGKLYRGSNRAYTGFLNKLRMDTFSSLMDDAAKGGAKVDPEQVADLVNVMTGRGKLGSFEGAAPLLNSIFFSPRFLSSRVKLLTSPVSYAKADPFVRKEALKSLAALVGSQATLIGLATAAGMKGSFNPTNSDFGKFKVGDSRVDTNAGLQQLVVLASRLATKQTQSSVTGKTSKLDSGKFGAPTSEGTVGRFLTSKEAPLASLIKELWTGKDFLNQDISKAETTIRHITPMIAQDLVDIMKDDPKNSWLMIPATFGASVNTYEKRRK